jgi:elongation factor G
MERRYIVSGPLVQVAVESETGNLGSLARALEAAVAENPSLQFSIDSDSGQTVFSGASEQDLAKASERLAKSISIRIGAPQVLYRECVTRAVDVDHTHKRQIGGAGEFARVALRVEQGEAGSDLSFENAAGDAVLSTHIPGILAALRSALENGILAGFPMLGFKTTLMGGAYHEIDSSAATFQAATGAAIRQLKDKRAHCLLEPIMTIKVKVSDEHLGRVIGDLNANRGVIEAVDRHEGFEVVSALVPLAGLLGYASRLATLSSNAGTFAMSYSHHEPVPRAIDGPDNFPPAIGMRA